MTDYQTPLNQEHERIPTEEVFETTSTTVLDFDEDGRSRLISVLAVGRNVEVLDVQVGEWE